ncbi:MAG: ATP-binding protein [Desulfobulbaceae bacterium]|nr:ATP-binding protein [Desulfobulbaceae bacterium]
MDIRFLPHNTHIEDPTLFHTLDPHLRQLSKLPLVYRSELLWQLPRLIPGIYTISGGRQVGKTTLLKQWMAQLIEENVEPARIAFLTGELIDDHHLLVRLLTDVLNAMPDMGLNFLILDEVTYIKDWDKGVKYLADAGLLENVVCILTGSDLVIIKEARLRFPGRRGQSDQVDFFLYPLNFFECVKLKSLFTHNEMDLLLNSVENPPADLMSRLFSEFQNHLTHGGFLTAINDFAGEGRILRATFSTYSDWIRGDVIKRNKKEGNLLEILEAIVKRYGSQITWNALAKDLSIDHPQTVADYINLLESMDAVFVQPAIREDKLAAAPKKARKIMFTDPFIFHAVNAWLNPVSDPFTQQVQPLTADSEWASKLTEACATTLYRRRFPTFYIKAMGEIDIAYIYENRFWPVEIKWTRQIRPKQLKQIAKYPNGIILTKLAVKGEMNGVPTEPLPLALLRLDA